MAGEYDVLRSLLRVLGLVAVVAVALAGVLGALLGPEALYLVFGDSVDVSSSLAGALAVGSTVAVANLALMVSALAQDRPAGVAGAWGVAVLVGAVGVVALAGESPAVRSSGGFVVAEVAATVVLTVLAVRTLRRS